MGPITDAAATYYGYWKPAVQYGLLIATVIAIELAILIVLLWRR